MAVIQQPLTQLSPWSFTKPRICLHHCKFLHQLDDHLPPLDFQLTFFKILDPKIHSPSWGLHATDPTTFILFLVPWYGLSTLPLHVSHLNSTASLCLFGRPSIPVDYQSTSLHTCPWIGKILGLEGSQQTEQCSWVGKRGQAQRTLTALRGGKAECRAQVYAGGRVWQKLVGRPGRSLRVFSSGCFYILSEWEQGHQMSVRWGKRCWKTEKTEGENEWTWYLSEGAAPLCSKLTSPLLPSPAPLPSLEPGRVW